MASYGALEAVRGERNDTVDFKESQGRDDSTDLQLDAHHKKETTYLSTALTFISMTLIALGLIMMTDVISSKYTSSKTTYLSQTKTSKASSPPTINSPSLSVSSVSNEYGEWDSSTMSAYKFLADAYLVEPYKETSLTLENLSTDCTYDWSFNSIGSGDLAESGTSTDGNIIFTLSTVGEYALSVSEDCGDLHDSHRKLSSTVWVKYVRRELSTLNDVDREEWLDAFHTLWTVSTTDGKILYGDRYKSVKYLATLHNDGGANGVCDEFHGSYGFLNNHIYLSMYLEQSLQLVNPRVALHYMEYTKYFESEAYQKHLNNQLDGGSWTEILTSKFFGASDSYTGRVTSGRWADYELPYLTTDFFEEEGIDPDHTFFPVEEAQWLGKTAAHLTSPYGLLRSPWNYNPSPYLARYGNVYGINDTDSFGVNKKRVFGFHMGVTCAKYDSFFTGTDGVRGEPLESFLVKMEDDTHGPFHFTFGGVGGEKAVAAVEVLRDTYGFSWSNIGALVVSSQHYFKKTKSDGGNDPVNCTADPWQDNDILMTALPGAEYGPQCDFADVYYESEENLDALLLAFNNFDPDPLDPYGKRLLAMSYENRAGAMKTIAGMFASDGDIASSGAAMDPLFWVAHGAVERLFQGAVFADIFTDMEYTSSSHCSGHSYSAAKAWLEGYYFLDESVDASVMTNAELTVVLDPSSDQYRDYLNYVYDSNTYEWCSESDTWFEPLTMTSMLRKQHY